MSDEASILQARILVVDDLDANLQLFERLLHGAGYTQVWSTMQPTEVCALHQLHDFDLILLDLQMPGMDGFEVMAALQPLHADGYLPVIVLTAQPAHKLRALQAGAKDFISKPFDLLEVKTRIHNMLEVRLLYKKLASFNQLLERTVAERTAELRESESRFRRLTELAADWYWEQNESGDFTTVSGPVQELLGLGLGAFLGHANKGSVSGWNEVERAQVQAAIAARRPFLDFSFSRTGADGVEHRYRVSGEPMFDQRSGFVGYRGIGCEVLTEACKVCKQSLLPTPMQAPPAHKPSRLLVGQPVDKVEV
ncbi:response regulator [Roseateles albus]|uniref:Response regulator n=1 Tax=Roseateles albus TaxID=2987525 RepID=A0ABT5KKH3_9BURK|nr:response regulator [Roseateles albus]MDC8773415.1 response regulator [Roseateles albus]